MTVKNNICIICNSQYSLVNGSCYSKKNFATSWDIAGNPTQAKIGYAVSMSYKVSLSLNYNCKEQNFENGVCKSCASYYKLVNFSCVIFDPYCISYNQRGICQACASKYTFIYGACRILQNCAVTNSNGICIGCMNSWILSSGMCLPPIVPNCALFASNSVCMYCSKGFYLTINKTCLIYPLNCKTVTNNGVCTDCMIDFRYFKFNNTCLAVVNYCLNYSTTDGNCLSCLPGYVLLKKNLTCYLNILNCIVLN
jgi:hypothetical protein